MTINLYRIYGVLGSEKQPIFAACAPASENPYDLVEADLPDGWNVCENYVNARLIESSDGTLCPLTDCLITLDNSPALNWPCSWNKKIVIRLKWRYANNTVRGWRDRRGLTQKALAEKAGINVRLLQKLELGEINIENITAKNLLSIADALDVEPIALFK